MYSIDQQPMDQALASMREHAGLNTDSPLECWAALRLRQAMLRGIDDEVSRHTFDIGHELQAAATRVYQILLLETTALKRRIVELEWDELKADDCFSKDERDQWISQLRQKLDLLGDQPAQEIRFSDDYNEIRLDESRPLKVVTRPRSDVSPEPTGWKW
jgi:hypothetical protein